MKNTKSGSDLWAEEILKAVAEVENQRYEERENISFDDTRYLDAYNEALLSSVY